jgi:hypothetical protein
MTLKRRLERLEHQAPPSGEHCPVMDIPARPDAQVQVYRCSCGQATCQQHPELTMVLKQPTLHTEG